MSLSVAERLGGAQSRPEPEGVFPKEPWELSQENTEADRQDGDQLSSGHGDLCRCGCELHLRGVGAAGHFTEKSLQGRDAGDMPAPEGSRMGTATQKPAFTISSDELWKENIP